MQEHNFLIVDCLQYGQKKLSYPTSMEKQEAGRRLLSELQKNWSNYWPLIMESTSEMALEVLGIYDFDASFETHDFVMEIYDMGDWSESDTIAIWLQFIDSHGRVIVPVFDTTFEDGEVTHCQPVF
ncbi:MAG: hypothetical protein RL095_3070 [Verrucomicrobiota bacterium]